MWQQLQSQDMQRSQNLTLTESFVKLLQEMCQSKQCSEIYAYILISISEFLKTNLVKFSLIQKFIIIFLSMTPFS